MLLNPSLFQVKATRDQQVTIATNNFVERVKRCTERDEKVVKALRELGTSGNLRGEEWKEEEGLICYRGKVYVPLDFQL